MLHREYTANPTDPNLQDLHTLGFIVDSIAELTSITQWQEGMSAWVRNGSLLYVVDAAGTWHLVSGLTDATAWQDPVLGLQSAPPVSPNEGDRYLVATPGSGDWAGHDEEIATWDGAAWTFQVADEGWFTWVLGVGLYYFTGAIWAPYSPSPLTTKGDIFAYSTGPDRFPLSGIDGMTLIRDDAEAFGFRWGLYDHAFLMNLQWDLSNHTGSGDTLFGSDGGGAPVEYLFVPVELGGTGLTGITANRMLFASATDVLSETFMTYSETPTEISMNSTSKVFRFDGHTILFTSGTGDIQFQAASNMLFQGSVAANYIFGGSTVFTIAQDRNITRRPLMFVEDGAPANPAGSGEVYLQARTGIEDHLWSQGNDGLVRLVTPVNQLSYKSALHRGVGAAGLQVTDGTAYAVFLGEIKYPKTFNTIRMAVTAASQTGTQAAEVGLYTSPAWPDGTSGQTLTRLAANDNLDSLATTGVKDNNTALNVAVPAGTYLWAVFRSAASGAEPTLSPIKDLQMGWILTAAGVGSLTAVGQATLAGTIPAYVEAGMAPSLTAF